MIKLRVDWQQTCQACGTELVVDFLDGSPTHCSCPWCGVAVSVSIPDGSPEAREKLVVAVRDLEARLNAELSP